MLEDLNLICVGSSSPENNRSYSHYFHAWKEEGRSRNLKPYPKVRDLIYGDEYLKH